MKATVPWRANCDALTQIRHKLRKEKPKRPPKRSYCCNTMEHLAVIYQDRYHYYHATKGWRSRRLSATQ
jgi:hypothetical protein